MVWHLFTLKWHYSIVQQMWFLQGLFDVLGSETQIPLLSRKGFFLRCSGVTFPKCCRRGSLYRQAPAGSALRPMAAIGAGRTCTPTDPLRWCRRHGARSRCEVVAKPRPAARCQERVCDFNVKTLTLYVCEIWPQNGMRCFQGCLLPDATIAASPSRY